MSTSRWADKEVVCTQWNITQPSKKSEIFPFNNMDGMDLEGIMLSEVSQTEKGKYHMIDTLYMQNLKYNKLVNKTKKADSERTN